MYVTTQPDCGFQRPIAYGPSTGTYDAVTGVECAFSDPLTTPYTVTDGLHTAHGTVSITYDNPGHPDLSSFDPSTITQLDYEDQGLVVHTDASSTGTIVVPGGTDIPVYHATVSPVSNVISIAAVIQCATCDGGIVVGTMDTLQPTLAASDADPTTGVLTGSPNAVLNTRVPVSLALNPLTPFHPVAIDPFEPIVTWAPPDPTCAVLCTQVPAGWSNYLGTLVNFDLLTLPQACAQIGGDLQWQGNSLGNWECSSVDVGPIEASNLLGGFCIPPLVGVYNSVGTLSMPAPGDWFCMWT